MEKTVYKGYMEIIEMESEIKGKTVIRERLKVDDAVACTLIDRRGYYGLVKQYRPAVNDYTYEIVAGTVDKNLSKEEILFEEIEEECEISTKDILVAYPLISMYTMIGISDTKLDIYEVHLTGEYENKKVSDADVEEIIWVSKEEYGEMIRTGKITDSKTILAYNL